MSNNNADGIIIIGALVMLGCLVFVWANNFVWTGYAKFSPACDILMIVLFGLTLFVVIICALSKPNKPEIAPKSELREYQ